MNREIKFRVWNGQKIWFPGHFSTDQYSHQLGFSGTTLMQYTGLKDKNGAEIYEGDIVQFPSIQPNISKVWYSDKVAAFVTDSALGSGYKLMGQPESMIVIGNTYENPELLK